MPKSPVKISLVVLVILLVFVFGGSFLKIKLGWSFDPAVSARTYLFSSSSLLRKAGYAISRWNQLAEENEVLRSENRLLKSKAGLMESLEKENAFLKKSLHLASETGTKVIPAGIYDISLSPAGYRALINKGTRDKVAENDVVATADGILIGLVNKVFPGTAQVVLANDPSFSVNGRILHGQTAGIARGMQNEGLRLDLVVQSDEVKEGDTLVANGSDLFPAGLIIGTVRQVEQNQPDLFKKVLLRPAYQDSLLDRVVVMSHQ